MQITRIYLNADGDTIRIDDIVIDITAPVAAMDPRLGSDLGLIMGVGPQKVITQKVYSSFAARVVDTIQIVGDFDDIEPSSGSFAWASKTLGNNQVVTFDMSNLPAINDTV